MGKCPLHEYNEYMMTAFSSTEIEMYRVQQTVKKMWQLTLMELEMK
jgi:hypothetical protein